MAGDIAKNDGTIVRAKRIFEIFKQRCDTALITKSNKALRLKDRVIIMPANKLWNLKLIPFIMKNKIDCIICSNDWFGFLTYFIFSKLYRYKIIMEVHGIISLESKELQFLKIATKLYQVLEKFVVKHADHVIALSENILKFYEKYNKNIDLIPVFVDENVFKINKNVKKYINNYKLIGLIGPFDYPTNKYFLEFLYTNINQFDYNIHFLLIGKCDNKINNDRITYMGYLDSIQDYVNELSRLDAVLVPSKVATSGPLNKIIEPMSCSLPVFTTPKGMVGLCYVEHGKNILVFEHDEIIDKINELIFDDELMKEIGENARVTIEKYYSKKSVEKKLMKVIQEVM